MVESEIRVRYAETDAEGVVYYSNYFIYMEVARVNYLRGIGFDINHWQRNGMGMVIAEALCRYHAPARFDDLLTIRAWIEDVRRSSFVFVYQMLRNADGRIIAEGRTVQVLVDLSTMRPTELPPDVSAALRAGAAPAPTT